MNTSTVTLPHIDRHTDPFLKEGFRECPEERHCGHQTFKTEADTDGDGYAGWDRCYCCWCGAEAGVRTGLRHHQPKGHGPHAACDVDIDVVAPPGWRLS